ncbi:aminoacyl tRNA synthase complex-interacting multifunctional protein 1 [Teleopsis dalmanni]|uniref:aminoacyl tRNA synthase complex-interacting multifunctional protein 1 n=1 Tax=Teleopsis dalmanni TaxID=139649 RepID=UPI0018CE5011|nr:aminoacyl tRNA synthase complex-interacting multifunctional protein 1 [Teleopsis dalmanni]
MTFINRIFTLQLAKLFKPKYLKAQINNMSDLQEIITKNKFNEEILTSLKHELKALQNELLVRKKQQLRAENADLNKKVVIAKSLLIELENRNGKVQIPIPGVRSCSTQATNAAPPATATKANTATATPVPAEQQTPKADKTTKEKKPKKEKPAQDTNNAVAAEAPIDVGRLDMRVGKIIDVNRHPDADSLYLEKIDCGEAQPRTVVSGLVKYVPIEDMQNRMVIVLCNLKPAKMRGIVSEAMVMCASTPEKVEVLSPPAGAVPGDLVHCEGYNRQPDAQLNPKKKIFETCAPDLLTNNDLVACYKGAVLHVPGKGNIVAQTLKNVNVK